MGIIIVYLSRWMDGFIFITLEHWHEPSLTDLDFLSALMTSESDDSSSSLNGGKAEITIRIVFVYFSDDSWSVQVLGLLQWNNINRRPYLTDWFFLLVKKSKLTMFVIKKRYWFSDKFKIVWKNEFRFNPWPFYTLYDSQYLISPFLKLYDLVTSNH